jgi:GAF domain-containing protein
MVDKSGARASLSVALRKDETLLGMINVYRQEVRPFTDKQIELVTNFANQAVIAIENARLLNELRESLEQQTATSEVLKVISSSPGELKPVFDAMLESATRICAATFGSMLLCDGDAYRRVALHNAPQRFLEYDKDAPIRRRGTAPIVDRVIDTRQVVHVLDPAAEDSALAKFANARTLLVVPMLKEHEAIGVIGIYRQEVRPFSDKQIELVTNFAAQAVIAIENARLLNELRQRTTDLTESLEQQTATSEILDVISNSPTDVRPVLDTIVRTAVTICDSYDAVILLKDGEQLRIAAHHGPIKIDIGGAPIARDWVSGRVVVDGVPVHVHDLTAEDTEFPLGRDIALRNNTRTVLGLPLLREGQAIGCLSLRRPDVRPFTEKQIGLLQTFADQAVIAIENTRLFEAEQQRTRELTESLEQQTATSDVLRVISSSPSDIQPVLETISERAEKLCNAEISVVSIVDGELIRLASIHGMTEAGVEASRRSFPMQRTDETITARAIRTRSVCHVADVLSDPEYQMKDAARISGFRGCLGVPMVRDEQVVGAIVVFRGQPGLFSDTQVQLLNTFADQAVIAIANVRLFKETKVSLEQQTATADVLKLISRSTFDLPTVLQTLVESAARFCEADKANIIREKDGVFYTAEAYGYSREFLDYMRNIPIKAERGSASGAH